MKAALENTAVLIIDYQEKLVPVMNHVLEFVHNSAKLIKGLDILGIPMIMTQQYTKGLGETISEISSIEGTLPAYEKMTFSALGEESIYNALDSLNVKNVIVCGCEAHICVLQTVIDLINEEYNVFLVSDCIASRKEQDKKMAVRRAEKEGARVTTYESILFELMESAEHIKFKEISKLIK